jgi:hypothetical protein
MQSVLPPREPGDVPTVEPRGMGAFIEIIEPYTESGASQDALDSLPCIKPRRVRVNGADVGLIAKDGISISPGEGFKDGTGNPTTVTLTLLPKTVTIKAE